MLAEGVATMSADGVRMYLRTLRDRQGITQEQAAKAAKLSVRTYVDYELGIIREIKLGPLVRLLSRLRGSIADVQYIVEHDLSAEQARSLAEVWLKLTDEEREQAVLTPGQKFAIMQETMTPAELALLFDEAANEMEPALIKAIRALIAGWRTPRGNGSMPSE